MASLLELTLARLSSLKYIAATIVSSDVTIGIWLDESGTGQFHKAGTPNDELALINLETRFKASKKGPIEDRLSLISSNFFSTFFDGVDLPPLILPLVTLESTKWCPQGSRLFRSSGSLQDVS